MYFKRLRLPFQNINKTLFNSKDEYGKNRSLIVKENYFTGITDSLINGNYFTGLLILLNVKDSMIGIISMLKAMGNIMQVFSPLFLERYHNKKKILIICRAIIYLLNIIFIGIIPFLPIENSLKVTLIIMLVLAVSFIGAIIGPGVAVWHVKSIPQKIRSDYFAFFLITLNIVVFISAFFASKFVDIFKANGNELIGLILLRIIAVIFCIFDIYYLTKIKEYPQVDNENIINLKDMFFVPFKHKRYRTTILISCMWSFCSNIVGQYFNIYLLKDLKITYATMSLVNMSFLVSLIFLTPVWSKKIKRTSIFKTLALLMTLFSIHYVGLAFTTKATIVLYPIFVFYSFIIFSGISLVLAVMPYENIPEENQINYIGFYTAINSIAAIIGMEIGVLFIEYTSNLKISLIGINIGNKQLIMLFAAFVTLCFGQIVSYMAKSNSFDDCIKE